MYYCFVLFYVLFVCKCVLPPGDNPIAVNKYIIFMLSSHQRVTTINVIVIVISTIVIVMDFTLSTIRSNR